MTAPSLLPKRRVEPEVGRQLCRDAIVEHVPADAVERYERKLNRVRRRLQRAIAQKVPA